MQEQELFQSYEVKNWDFNPRIYKIAAMAAICNILALLIVGQTNLLTKKGCDSPLVGRVCQVIDTLYVGTTILSKETEYVSEKYEPTELADADITWIDQTGAEKFNYPEGYFGQSNPELTAINQGGISPIENGYFPNIPGIPNSTNPTINGGGTTDLLSKPQELPKTNRNAVKGGIPDSPFSIGGGNNPTIYRPKTQKMPSWKNPMISKKSPDKLPNLTPDNPDNTAVKDVNKEDKNKIQTPVKSENDSAIKINPLPLKDLKVFVKGLQDKGQVSLSSPFSVQAKGKLNKDGKIDSKNFKFILAESPDKNMIEVVKKSIASLNDSGYLQYLTNLSGKDLEFNFKQDGTTLTAIVQSELETDTRANSISSALSFLIGLSKQKKESAIASMQAENKPEKMQDLQNEIDDLELLKNAKVTHDGKKIVIEFAVPQDISTKMIERKLNEPEKPEKQENKAQSNAPPTNSNKVAVIK